MECGIWMHLRYIIAVIPPFPDDQRALIDPIPLDCFSISGSAEPVEFFTPSFSSETFIT